MVDAGMRVAGRVQSADITLEAVALEAGVSKSGLMYHFPTRRSLMIALVDSAAAQMQARMILALGKSLERATVTERYRAYIKASAAGNNIRAEWSLWYQSGFRPELQEAWTRHLRAWLILPEDMPPAQRLRLTAARLAADGLWAARASGVLASAGSDGTALVTHMMDSTQEWHEH